MLSCYFFILLDINKALLAHIVSGGGLAIEQLRRRLYTFPRGKKNNYDRFLLDLRTFLEARTDTRRIIYSERVAETVLDSFDLSELADIRRKVAEFELGRIIEY